MPIINTNSSTISDTGGGYTTRYATGSGPGPGTTTTAYPTSPTSETTVKFLPNSLDSYDVYTYHWKLFITTLENAASGSVLTASNQVIIAESGVTDLTIDKVELHGIAVPSVEAGTGTQTTIKFEIVEPAGAGLLDKLFYEALGLGIGNWLVMPCFLQLEFRGRNPDTGQSEISGTSGGLGSQRWVWPVKLTNVKANVTNVGTRYEFDTIMYDELAQSNSYFSIQHNIVLHNVSNFATAMADLEQKLNEDQFEKLIDNYSIPDTYKIYVDPSIATVATELVSDQNKDSSRGGGYINFKEKTATFAAGTGIDKIVDSLLANTDYFARKLQSSTTRDSTPETLTQQTNQMKKLWRIITETKPIAFDALRQNNAVAITIWIVEYDLGAVMADAAQTGQTSNTITAEVKRFNEYASKRIMNKVYNYIFTGLNDQIYNFDLNMNFSFAAALSRFGGYYINSTSQDKGAKQIDVDAAANAAKQLSQTLQFINNAPANTNVDSQIAATQAAIKNSTLDQATQDRYTALLGYAKPGSPVNFTQINQSIQQQGGITANGTPSNLATAQKYAGNLAQPVSATNANGENISLSFISDVQTNSATAKAAASTFDNISGGKLRPISFAETNQDQNVGQGIEATNDPSRARVSSIFSTALYSTLDASLQYIKLTIKGDPYWLFPGSINSSQTQLVYKSTFADQNQAFAIIKKSQTRNLSYEQASINMFGTDNFIVIRFRTPSIYTQAGDPGAIGTEGTTRTTSSSDSPLETVDTFSGVYRVITVISKFESGRFTQELTCMLDPVINVNIDQIRTQIEQAIQQMSPIVPPITAPTPAPTSITSTSKTQPIVSNNNNFPPGMNPNYPGLPSTNIGPNTQGTSNIPIGQFQSADQLISQTIAAANK